MSRGAPPEPFLGPRHFWRVRYVRRALEAAAPIGALLDAGCGYGTLAVDLARGGRVVFAADRDRGRLSAARRHARASGSAVSPHWICCDLTAIPLAGASIRGVAAGEVLEHVADDDAAARELARVLTAGGYLVATVPSGSRRFTAADRTAGHVRRYDRDRLERVLGDAGFEIRGLRGWGFPFGRLYDRWVQRPALRARRAHGRRLVRWGRTSWLSALWLALFRLDESIDPGGHGSGWLVIAIRRRDM